MASDGNSSRCLTTLFCYTRPSPAARCLVNKSNRSRVRWHARKLPATQPTNRPTNQPARNTPANPPAVSFCLSVSVSLSSQTHHCTPRSCPSLCGGEGGKLQAKMNRWKCSESSAQPLFAPATIHCLSIPTTTTTTPTINATTTITTST
ncbi:hypothetical protein E2C01_016703 [Portunus trituberculatus]|uniref:Uncharacterized protein n=1 Tax=Portunus trituberculatus TaxID=210409 RepID=A0A5B7DRH0_PORTR|nr:hypothetical protein [Portunus trituberculatus]